MTLERFGSFVLPASAIFAIILNVFEAALDWARLGAVLVGLILLQLFRHPRIPVRREFALYFVYVGYMVIGLLWTANVILAMNTLVPAIDFLLILILFGALVTYHDSRTVLAGTLGGFLLGAVSYTLTTGFPFVYPSDFAYNAIAIMYLFGLFITLIFGWISRSTVMSFSIGLILLAHIAMTTSIKTNLGILLGAAVVGLMYSKFILGALRRMAIPLAVITCMLAYAVVSNHALVDGIEKGVGRVELGIRILEAGRNEPGYTGFEKRKRWTEESIKGWAQKPLFGHGVEAFRYQYGITSHSTPADLLYNFGLIGFSLFYGMFISVAVRLLRIHNRSVDGVRALVLGALVCFLFISFSGTVHYNAFLAVFIAISAALLRKYQSEASRNGIAELKPRIQGL